MPSERDIPELDELTREAYKKLYESKLAELKNRLRSAGDNSNSHNAMHQGFLAAITVLDQVNELCRRLGFARIGPASLYKENADA